MERPNLSNIIDAVVPILEASPDNILRQLRNELSLAIRSLEKSGLINWFCFLVHDRDSAGREDLPESFPALFFHVRLGLLEGADHREFITKLGSPFQYPVQKALGEIGGINISSMHGDWSEAWWLIGEVSELVLKLAESHSDSNKAPVPQIIQFLHYITNGLGIGGRSIFFQGDIQYF